MRLIKQKSKFLVVLLSFAILLMIVKPLSVSAESGDNLDRSGVLQINMYHLDANTNQKFWLGQGSGFLISDTEDGAQYVITCNHVVSLTPEEEAEAAAYYGVERLNIKIEVVVTRDITQNCTIVKTSEDDDFAILKLDEPIYQRNALALDPEGPGLTEDVYAMGYPSAVQDVQDFTYYTEDDVTVTKGSVSMKENKIGGVPYVQHSAVVTEGNSGGPLLDSTGAVIGVNTFLYDVGGGTYYYSLCIKEVTEVLDALGIKYKTATPIPDPNTTEATTEVTTEPMTESGDDPVEPTTEPINSVNKNALSEAIADAKGYTKDEFTEESYKALQDAISSATEVLNNSDSTQSDVDAAVSSLNNAIDDLEKSGNNTTLIIIIIIAVILVIVIVIVIIAISSGKKKKNAGPYGGAPRPMAPPATPQVPVSPQLIQSPIPPTPPTPPIVPTAAIQQPTAPVFQGEGAGETSVLGYGQGETTVLNGNNHVRASLTRVKTNEKVDITKQLFRVGKERNKVDYCVTNNNAVSRIHADIVYKNGQYFVIDNNSTNYTFVNGQMIAAKQEVALSDGDRIKFAEEEFIFNVG